MRIRSQLRESIEDLSIGRRAEPRSFRIHVLACCPVDLQRNRALPNAVNEAVAISNVRLLPNASTSDSSSDVLRTACRTGV